MSECQQIISAYALNPADPPSSCSVIWRAEGGHAGLRADQSLGLVVEDDDDLVRVLFRVAKSQAADREIDDFIIVPRSRPA